LVAPRRNFFAVITLFFVAPLVAEYLLGDLPLKMLAALIVLAPAYGGGAVLIREAGRVAPVPVPFPDHDKGAPVPRTWGPVRLWTPIGRKKPAV